MIRCLRGLKVSYGGFNCRFLFSLFIIYYPDFLL